MSLAVSEHRASETAGGGKGRLKAGRYQGCRAHKGHIKSLELVLSAVQSNWSVLSKGNLFSIHFKDHSGC